MLLILMHLILSKRQAILNNGSYKMGDTDGLMLLDADPKRKAKLLRCLSIRFKLSTKLPKKLVNFMNAISRTCSLCI